MAAKWPYVIETGETVKQSVSITITAVDAVPVGHMVQLPAAETQEAVQVIVNTDRVLHPMPKIGVDITSVDCNNTEQVQAVQDSAVQVIVGLIDTTAEAEDIAATLQRYQLLQQRLGNAELNLEVNVIGLAVFSLMWS